MLKFPILIVLFVAFCEVRAQESVLTGGGNAEGANGAVSYSVGQVAYRNFLGSSGTSAEGVQQPYEISIVTEIQESDLVDFDLTTFPNPVKDNFSVQVTPWDGTPIDYRMLDSSGKTIHTGAISAKQTSIDTHQWSNGQYVLQLAAPVHRSIRIIKIQ